MINYTPFIKFNALFAFFRKVILHSTISCKAPFVTSTKLTYLYDDLMKNWCYTKIDEQNKVET